MNVTDDRRQHPFRTVTGMRSVLSLLRGLGTAGAVANAKAELETAHVLNLQAAVVAKRVNSSVHDLPLRSVAEARVA